MPTFANLKRYPRLEPDQATALRKKGTAISATTAESAIALNPRTLEEIEWDAGIGLFQRKSVARP